MPRYYFHLHNHVEATDEEGRILPDLAAARAEALKAARALMAENVREGELCLSHWIEVENEAGQQVLAVRFADCIEVRL